VASFFGNYDYSVDAKGRVNIPSKFRKSLSAEDEERFFVVRGPKNNLRAYPKAAWDKRADKLSALPETPRNLSLKQMIFGNLSDSTLDVQGRIMLTPDLMDYAQITKEVTLVGMSEYIELWETGKYKEHIGGSPKDFDEAFYAVEAELGESGDE
jgi:MraZ protein